MKALYLTPVLLSTLVSAQEKAPSLTDRFKVESPAINQLIASFETAQALAKAEALLPPVKPTFDKSSPQAGLASSQNFSTLMACYSLAGKAAVTGGDWTKALDYFHKAQDIAVENSTETTALLTPVIDNWSKAVDTAQKSLTDGAARRAELQAKATRTPSEETELKNFQIFEDNTKKGPMVIQNLKGNLDGLKSDSEGFTGVIEGVEKSLKAETEQLQGAPFKGDKVKYVAAVMNTSNLAARTTKGDKIAFLNRLLFLDPASKKTQHQLDIVMGKAAPEPEKAPSHKGKKKGH